MKMKLIKNTYWSIYLLICSIELFASFSLLLKDREMLRALLENGGLIESSPALIYLMISILSFIAIIKTKKIFPHVICGAVSIFFVGEESAWGRESVLGWQILSENSPFDVHNSIADYLAQSSRFSLLAIGLTTLLAITLYL